MVERVRATKKRLTKGIVGAGWASALVAGVLGFRAIADRRRRARAGFLSNSAFAVGRGRSKGPVGMGSREAGYEVSDANVRALAAIMVGSTTFLLCALATVYFVYGRFDRHFRSEAVGLTAEQRSPIPPPLPHLQANPYRDRDAALMEQERRLTTYGNAAPDGQGAHIPIERAMRQVVGHPLDASAAADAVGSPSHARNPGTDGQAPGREGAAPGEAASFPSLPAFEAARRQNKPANYVEGDERAGAVAPSYDPAHRGQAK